MKTINVLVFIAVLFFSGCSSTNPVLCTDTIITKYTEKYVTISSIDKNTDDHDIAAMLQTFTVDLIHHPSETWKDVSDRENQYISIVTTNYISSVYTIMASANEIIIVDGFLDEIISYFESIENDYASFAGSFLGESATKFITNIENYEYEKFNDF